MDDAGVEVAEVFTGIQGESTWAGCPCFFVRLAGCNLACSYCDTTWASRAGEGRRMTIANLVDRYRDSGQWMAEVTGGEPLLQPGFPALAEGLIAAGGRPVLVETNGSLDLGLIPEGAVAVVDVKCPGSGAGGSFLPENVGRVRPADEVKFVVGDRRDYEWARAFTLEHSLADRCAAVLFSPVWGAVEGVELGRWVMEDGLHGRLQLPLHKVLGVP